MGLSERYSPSPPSGAIQPLTDLTQLRLTVNAGVAGVGTVTVAGALAHATLDGVHLRVGELSDRLFVQTEGAREFDLSHNRRN